MNPRHLLALALALGLWPLAPLLFADSPTAQSASYQLDVAVVAPGGTSSGGVYQNTGALGDTAPTLTDVSTAGAQNRAGFVASLYEVISLGVSPGTVNEATSDIPLAGTVTYDDDTTAALTGSEILWSGFAPPLSGIATGGLLTTGAVSADTPSPLTLEYAGVQTVTSLTVLDSDWDNFGNFAGDDLPDAWQIDNGLMLENAGFGDNPDGDDWPNAFELLLGLDPLVPDDASVPYDRGFDVNGFLTLTYQRNKEAALLYLTIREESSLDLVNWDPNNVVVSVNSLDAETEEVVVRSTNDPATVPRDFLQVVVEPKE